MFCAYTRPRYQVSVYRTIGPLVFFIIQGYWSLSSPYRETDPLVNACICILEINLANLDFNGTVVYKLVPEKQKA